MHVSLTRKSSHTAPTGQPTSQWPTLWPKYKKVYFSLNSVSDQVTFLSLGFVYKVAPPELKISAIMYFVMYNSVVLSKIMKIIVALEQNFEKTDFYSIKFVILIIIDIGK